MSSESRVLAVVSSRYPRVMRGFRFVRIVLVHAEVLELGGHRATVAGWPVSSIQPSLMRAPMVRRTRPSEYKDPSTIAAVRGCSCSPSRLAASALVTSTARIARSRGRGGAASPSPDRSLLNPCFLAVAAEVVIEPSWS